MKFGATKDENLETAMDTRDFVTLAMMTVKHSVAHRPKLREKVQANQETREPR